MSATYAPLSNTDLAILAELEGFPVPVWTGPAIPLPQGVEGLEQVLGQLHGILSRAQYMIQGKDALSLTYTLRGITATAERFLFGSEQDVEKPAEIRGLLTWLESFLERSSLADSLDHDTLAGLRELRGNVGSGFKASIPAAAHTASGKLATNPTDDYSTFALEDPSQFSIGWTTLDDAARLGFKQLDELVGAFTNSRKATESFWPSFSSAALPYNLLVLRHLQNETVEPFRTHFGASWLPAYDDLLEAGKLYGIDMTIFAGIEPATFSNNTTRFTPSTMLLLEKQTTEQELTMKPLAVYVADPMDVNNSAVYTETSPAWIYGLLAVRTSLTVYGICLGHLYALHVVAAAMQMAMWNTLPKSHVLYQALAPQSDFTTAFNAVLLLGWSYLAPPTSISDTGKLLTLCNTFSTTHDYFSLDPKTRLAELHLDAADFTSSGPGAEAWDLYPNVQRMLKVWTLTENYVREVVDSAYRSDAEVASDQNVQRWIQTASAPNQGNVIGLPRVSSKDLLVSVVTSMLYRVNVHGLGRLRNTSAPELSFVPSWPPCLQSSGVPGANDAVSTADLLSKYLPVTGTIAGLVSFFGIFAWTEPYVPLVPVKGPGTQPFFDDAAYPGANAALKRLQQGIESLVRELQPEWVQVGQWPLNIEL